MSESLESIPELEPDVAAMIAAYAGETTRAPAQIEAALGQVTAKLAAPAAATSVGVTTWVAKLALAGVVAGGGAWLALRPSAPTSPPVAVHTPSDAVPTASEPPSTRVADVPVVVVEPVLDDVAPVEPPPRAVSPPTATPRTKRLAERPANEAEPAQDEPRVSLAEELRLLKEARGALRVGDGARALERVRTHRHEYPNSTLAEERDATEVMALCALGRADEARTMAASHERSYGRSQQPLLAACTDTPSEGVRP